MGLYGAIWGRFPILLLPLPFLHKNKSPVVKLTTEQHEFGYKNKNRLTEMKRFLGHSFPFSSLYHTKNYYGNYDMLRVYL